MKRSLLSTCPTLLTLVFWWLPVPKSTSLASAMSHVVGFVYPDLWQRSIQLVANQIMSFIWNRLVSGTFHFCLLRSCLKFTINIQYFFSSVAQSCPTLCDHMDCSLPGSSVHGILQARILEWVAISFSRRSSWLRDWTPVSRIVVRRLTVWATREIST